MNIKDGLKTVEFWIIPITTLLSVLLPEFPKEALIALYSWAGIRSTQKFFGMVDSKTGKRSWATSEFWLTLAYSIAVTIFPGIPAEALVGVITWGALRTGVKWTAPKETINK